MKENSHAMLRSSGYGFPDVSSGLLLPGLNAGSEMLRTKFGFLILNSRFLILVLVGICAFVGVGAAADTVNYDTAWTFVYDGGKQTDGSAIEDKFFDVKAMPNSGVICVGTTLDSNGWGHTLLMRINANGKSAWKKMYKGTFGHSIVIAKNGDFVIGGRRSIYPWLLRTDTLGTIKWGAWVYDSINGKAKYLSRDATINCVRETSRGTFICAAGDVYPDNDGLKLKNYMAYFEFDSTGNMMHWGNLTDYPGYELGGFCIDEGTTGDYFLSGNRAVISLDTSGHLVWEKKYTIWLEGVGTVTNNITRCKKLRNGSLMVAGQAYEGNCWNNFKSLYYDAWWSPISITNGANTTWDTLGRQGGDDKIYDFTQLDNGNIVFVGKKSTVNDSGGIWSFVTDSTGKNVLWERQVQIVYGTANSKALRPLSVCPTRDSGFTIVGEYGAGNANGASNAFAAHYVPKQIVATIPQLQFKSLTLNPHYRIIGTQVRFSFDLMQTSDIELSVFNAQGRQVAHILTKSRQVGECTVQWDASESGTGLYVYSIIRNGIPASSGTCTIPAGGQ
jgi:hypothetical protein